MSATGYKVLSVDIGGTKTMVALMKRAVSSTAVWLRPHRVARPRTGCVARQIWGAISQHRPAALQRR